MRTNSGYFILVLLLLFVLTSVGLVGAQEKTETPTNTPTLTPSPTSTATASPTSTATTSATSTVTASPTSTVTASPTSTPTDTPTSTPVPAPGSEESPIEIYFVPSMEVETLTASGEAMAEALKKATGLNFKVVVPATYADMVNGMCSAPNVSMGFLPAAGYVVANRQCGVQVAGAALHNGWTVAWAAYFMRRDSSIYAFGDLAGKSWSYPALDAPLAYIEPSVELQAAGIEPGERFESGGDSQVIQAVYSGKAEFGTTFFLPPVGTGAAWRPGDNPEPYDLSILESRITDNGDLFVGDFKILDARTSISEASPDVADKVRILRLSAPVPNETFSFGPGVPDDIKAKIMDALVDYSKLPDWTSGGEIDYYGTEGIAPIKDAAYDPIRQQIDIRGLTDADILK